MMMKKTTSALAVAALLGTGAASAATFQVDDNTTFSISGDIELQYIEEDKGATEETNITGGGSEIKFDGEQQSSNGLTSFFHTELGGFDIANSAAQDVTSNNTYFGVNGDFGTILYGSANTAYDAIVDITDLLNDAYGTFDGSGDNEKMLQYASPNFNGISVVIDQQIQGSNDSGTEEMTLRVDYDAGYGTFHVGYAEREEKDVAGDDALEVVDGSLIGIGMSGMSVGGIDLGVKYTMHDATATVEEDIIGITAGTSLGPVYAQFVGNRVDRDGGDTRTELTGGIYYPIADSLGAYVEASALDDADGLGDKLAFGANYKF
jgi:predicted porin